MIASATFGYVTKLISRTLVWRAAWLSSSSLRRSSKIDVASRIMLRCKNKSAMLLMSHGGGVILLICCASCIALAGSRIIKDCNMYM